jgi:hypothetical protein
MSILRSTLEVGKTTCFSPTMSQDEMPINLFYIFLVRRRCILNFICCVGVTPLFHFKEKVSQA